MSNSRNPEIEYQVHNDTEWIELAGKAKKELGAVLNYGNPRVTAWKCLKCKRIVFFESHNDQPLQWFKPEISYNEDW